jgi:hypothetical protein
MTIPTQRTPEAPALTWFREGDFDSDPLEFESGTHGTAIEAAEELLAFRGAVRTDARTNNRVAVRCNDGRVSEWHGFHVNPRDITPTDVREWADTMPNTPLYRAIEEFAHEVADEAEGERLRVLALRFVEAVVGPSVAAMDAAAVVER